MNYARIRRLYLFWVWVVLLGVYLLGGGWLLYQGAREQVARGQSVAAVMLMPDSLHPVQVRNE